MKRFGNAFVKILLLSGLVLRIGLPYAFAQNQDSLRSLQEVIVSEKKQHLPTHSILPEQSIEGKQLQQSTALQASDVVKQFAGANVKDYGGVGGMKTVSVRSLGANHTVVGYDGVAVSDGQSGQIDLSRFSISNLQTVRLSNGQSSELLSSARLLASGSTLTLQTIRPTFTATEKAKLALQLQGGSFGLFNPAFLLQNKWSNRITSSLSADYTQIKGDYPFTVHYTQNNQDSSSTEHRKNSDVKSLRTEFNLYALTRNDAQWDNKLYLYYSERGLPSLIWYNTAESEQRLENLNYFLQSQYTQALTPTLRLRVSGKVGRQETRYTDPAFLNTTGIDDRYYQNEVYFSGTLCQRVLSSLSVALAADGSLNTLRTNAEEYANPNRWLSQTALTAKFTPKHWQITGGLLLTASSDKTENGEAAKNYTKLTPNIGIAYTLLNTNNHDVRLRAFYKNIFRLPTFDDLYYINVGNPNLKPENAQQFNGGATYTYTNNEHLVRQFLFTADAYYNDITDKIVAVPIKNLFQWSMLNFGKVEITGLDITTSLLLYIYKDISVELNGSYTRQVAIDRTDPKGKTYNHQIPYTPINSGAFGMRLQLDHLYLGASASLSGKRYALAQNIEENRLDPYTEINLLAGYRLEILNTECELQGEILNITDEQYQIVKNYPMPGRAFRVKLNVNLTCNKKSTNI